VVIHVAFERVVPKPLDVEDKVLNGTGA